jgi:branched-chain amino acid transport system permease protein
VAGATRGDSGVSAIGLRWVGRAALAAMGVVLVALPWQLSLADQSLYTQMGQYAIVAIGLSLLMGFAGQVSFGQGAFYLLGAYVAGVMAMRYHWPTLATLVLAPFATAAVAYVLGLPLLRLRGHYLAFATLAVHLIFLSLVFTWVGVTGGQIGLIGVPKLKIGGGYPAGATYASIVWVLVVAVALVSLALVSSRAGRALRAIAANERDAAAAGIDVGAFKLRLFVLSGGYAGLAGGLYTYQLHYLSPDAFPIVLSVQFVVMIAIGGMGSIYGAVFGAIGITLLQHELSILGTRPGMPLQAPKVLAIGAFGLILTVVILFFQRGLLPALVDLTRRILPQLAPAEPALAAAQLPGEAERAAELGSLRGRADSATRETDG